MCFQLSAKMKNDLKPMIVVEDSQEEQETKENYYFRVIGEDRKIHVSDLQNNLCKCGVKIMRKYVHEKDYTGINRMFSCYECDWSTY